MKIDRDIYIEHLEEERDKLLKSNPKLQAFQQEIDEKLKKFGNDHNARAKYMIDWLNVHMKKSFIPSINKLNKISKKIEKKQQT